MTGSDTNFGMQDTALLKSNRSGIPRHRQRQRASNSFRPLSILSFLQAGTTDHCGASETLSALGFCLAAKAINFWTKSSENRSFDRSDKL